MMIENDPLEMLLRIKSCIRKLIDFCIDLISMRDKSFALSYPKSIENYTALLVFSLFPVMIVNTILILFLMQLQESSTTH